jgi:hypothetical protein
MTESGGESRIHEAPRRWPGRLDIYTRPARRPTDQPTDRPTGPASGHSRVVRPDFLASSIDRHSSSERKDPLRSRVTFAPGRYGPYADRLAHVLDAMEGHYLIGLGDRFARVTELIPINLTAGSFSEARAVFESEQANSDRLEALMRLVDGFETLTAWNFWPPCTLLLSRRRQRLTPQICRHGSLPGACARHACSRTTCRSPPSGWRLISCYQSDEGIRTRSKAIQVS